MSVKIGNETFTTLDDYLNDETHVDAAERAQIEFETELIGKLIEARERQGLSQRELARLSGVKQPAIARMESMKSTPQIDTLFKVLQPLGYTLTIVPTSK
jgi:DNA-binding XRE family transcriptional regulator